MKQVNLREWDDLAGDEKGRELMAEIDRQVMFQLDCLEDDLRREKITEAEFYEEIGCSKYYAESTSWFVPSVYYENHKASVDAMAADNVRECLYDTLGHPLWSV